MLNVSVVTQDEVIKEFIDRGYYQWEPGAPAPPPGIEPAVLPPGVEPPPPPEFPPGVEPPPPEFPPGIEPPVEKRPRAWLWLALGLLVASLGIQEDEEAA